MSQVDAGADEIPNTDRSLLLRSARDSNTSELPFRNQRLSRHATRPEGNARNTVPTKQHRFNDLQNYPWGEGRA